MTVELFTSESVTSGHPDKLCDAISDTIVDACLAVDSNARVAVETLVKGSPDKSIIVLAGEVSLNGEAPDYEALARRAAADIGYVDHAIGMDATTPDLTDVHVHITTQAANIAQGVNDLGVAQGAGDQGLMFGYACNETEAYDDLKGRYFPLAAALSQRLTRRLTAVREEGVLPWARPDGKSQVTVRYEEGKAPVVDTVVIAIQHDNGLIDVHGSEQAERAFVESEVRSNVVEHAIPAELLPETYRLVVNGTGRFADPGGPHADAGLTGRKIIVDTYGGMGRHGGGAFSGKDPSKVDRSAAYAARWAAKHVVAAGLATKCEIQLAYVIGVAEPVSLRAESFGTSTLDDNALSDLVREVFDFRPASIAARLNLLKPIYAPTAAGGHFGRQAGADGTFPWEALDPSILDALRG
ncbi:MAG TPA: methionine adenosyltransferase [Candidatus Poseidoniaceae archaeon]|nr:MAG TPA: methionine adenosyltransferase [Candidatus Poseidoniales archaeon]HIH53352.1 methionine adenosyltransferase [Candidatus Poseidoniaceae archaeon]